MALRKMKKSLDRKIYRKTASRTRKENVKVPMIRGGVWL